MISQTRPFLSIVIPVFNSELHLNRCIDSLLETSFHNIEILLINDGSSDGSGSICNTYAQRDSRIKAFHQSNAGVAAARNKGVQEAYGEWIYFVDSDDWVDKDGLTDLIQTVKQYPEAEVTRCFPRELRDGVPSLNAMMPLKEKLCERDNFLKEDLLGGYVHSLLVSKALLDAHKLRFDESLAFGEDIEFTFRCVLNSRKVLVYHKAFYNYVLNDVSYSHSMPLSKIAYLLKTATVMNHYAQGFTGEAVRLRSLKLLDSGLYSYFINISNHQPLSEISNREVRSQLLGFLKQNKLSLLKVNYLNAVLTVMSFLNVRLVIYAYKLLTAVKH
mgnify:CR=1 FL=1